MAREQEKIALKGEIEQLQKSLKLIYAVVRLPKLCTLMHQTERKRLTEKEIERQNKSAVKVITEQGGLSLDMHSDSVMQTAFIEDLVSKVHRQTDCHRIDVQTDTESVFSMTNSRQLRAYSR